MSINVGINVSVANSAAATSVTTASVTTSTSGSSIYAGMVWDTLGNFSSLTDSKSNTWTQLDSEVSFSLGKARHYYAQNITGGSGHTFTFTLDSSRFMALFILEITNCFTSGVIDVSGAIADTTSPFTSTSITTVNPAVLVASYCSDNSQVTGNNYSESTGFTIDNQITTANTTWTGAIGHKIAGSPGSFQSSWTSSSGTSLQAGVFIAAFKEIKIPFNPSLQPYPVMM